MEKENIDNNQLKKIINDYRKAIVEHDNFKNIPFKKKENGEIAWIAPKINEIGNKRIIWANQKIKELNWNIEPGCYAKLMLYIHPSKKKPCDICGKEMSLEYVYLNKPFIKKIEKYFPNLTVKTNETTSIYNLIDLFSHNLEEIKNFLIKNFDIKEVNSLDDIVNLCIEKAASGKSKLLGPGAMSNFPDRLDGFHTYNRCCRKIKDTGRHDNNMKKYAKDRRAYEYFADGNFQRANSYMKSSFFDDISADHGGPISLGFIHDMFNLFKMGKSKNSSKRDRIILETIVDLIKIEKEKKIIMVSWFSINIWNFIKQDISFIGNLAKISQEEKKRTEEFYYKILKQNMINFMYILNEILLEELGESFIIEKLLKPKYMYFEKEYCFPTIDSYIETQKKLTDSNKKEIPRLNRVSINAIKDFAEKDNRKHEENLTQELKNDIRQISNKIKQGEIFFQEAYEILVELMKKSNILVLNSNKK